jgi:ABC-type branched-subunit amino acid transport system substrate-binding protein
LLGQDALTVSRFGPFIDAWANAGYFDPGSKVGILLGDDGTGSRIHLANDIWVPELKARGLDPVVFEYRDINGYNDVSRVTSLFSQAVLKFNAAGVNHVIFPPDQSNGVIFFTQVADSQGYHPRYGITSESGAQSWFSVSASQRSNAVAVSYKITDVALDQSLVDQNPSVPSRTHCEQLYEPQNIIPDYRWCDFLQFLQEALANTDFTPQALQAGIEALGTSHQSALGYSSTRFGPDPHDGLAQIRTMVWDDNANQWSYSSPPSDVP